jgi:hypothetical protein
VNSSLRLKLRPSRIFSGVILFLHGSAALFILLLPITPMLRFFILLLLCATAIRTLQQQMRTTLLLSGEHVYFSDERKYRIAHHSFVHPFLVILCLHQQRAIVIFPDALDEASFRRVRIYLHFGLEKSPTVFQRLLSWIRQRLRRRPPPAA